MAVGGQYTVQLRAILDTKGVLAQIAQIQKQAGKIMIGGTGATKGASGIAAVGKEANRTAAGVRRLNAAVDTTGKSVKKIEGKKLAGAYTSVGKGAKEATSNVKTFGSTTLDVTKKVIQFGAVTAAIRGVTTGMGAMVQEVFTLDSALTEFKKVSDLTNDELKDYTKQAYEAGEATAKTGVEMIEAATQFKKMGYGEDTSLELATTATMFQNIADAEISAGEAALFINSQMKAFSGEFSKYATEGERAQKIIDSVNEVANNYAVGTNDLQLALTKTSAAMGTFGNSFDQTLGIMTAGTEIMVGMPSQVARGWRTIAANISKVGESAKEYKDASGEVNITMKKQNGEIKNTYEFLTDLYKGQKGVSKAWDELNKDQKTAIALELAGKNNQEKFLAVMNNFETALSATETAEKSHGSAMRENARYMDSLEGRVQALRSAWSRFSNAMLKSDTLKTVLSGLTKGLSLLASDTGASMVKFAAGMAMVGVAGKGVNGILGKVGGAMGKTSGAATKGSKGVSKLTKAFGKGGGAIGKFVGKFGKFAGLFMGSGAVWVAGIAAAAYGLYKLYQHMNKGKDTTEKYNKSLEDFEKTQQEYKDITTEIADLQTKVDMGTATRGEEKRLRYLKEQKAELKEQLELKQKIMQYDFKDDVTQKPQKEKYNTEFNKARDEGKSIQEAKKIASEASKGYTELTQTTEQWTKANQEAGTILDKVQKQQEKFNNTKEDTEEWRKAKEDLDYYQKQYDDVIKQSKDYKKTLSDQIAEWDKVYDSVDDMPSEIRASYEEAKKLESASSNLSALAESVQFDKPDVGAMEWEVVTNSIKSMGDAIGVATDKAGNFTNIDLSTFSAGLQSMGFEAEDVGGILQHISEINPEATISLGGEEVALGQVENFEQVLDVLNGKESISNIKLDAEEAMKDAKKTAEDLEVFGGIHETATLDADSKPAKKNIKETEKQGKKYSKKKYKSKLDSDNKSANKKIKETEKQGKKYGKGKYKAKLDADSSGAEKGTGEATQAVETFSGKEAIAYLREHGAEAVRTEVTETGETVLTMPDGKTVTITETGAKQGEKNVGSLDKSVGKLKDKSVNVSASTSGKGGVTSLKSVIDSVKSKSVTVTVNYRSTGTKPPGHAKGTRSAPAGLAEVNEEGWEFIRDAKTGQLRIAGGGQRTVTHLNKGDAVYTHQESKRMVAQGEIDIKIPQHKKGKKSKKEIKKEAQDKYNKGWEKRKDKYEGALDAVEYTATMQHWSEQALADVQKKVYDKHIKALRKWNKSKAVRALVKSGAKTKKGFGIEAYRERMTEREEARSEERNSKIEERISNLEKNYSKKSAKKLRKDLASFRKKKKISAQEYKDYLDDIKEIEHDNRVDRITESLNSFGLGGKIKSGKDKGKYDDRITQKEVSNKVSSLKALRKKNLITAEEYKEFLDEIYHAYLDNQMHMYETGRKTYADMKKDLLAYAKAGKITWAEYYEYVENLSEEQLSKEQERLGKLQKKNNDTYSLAKSWIDRKIDQLTKENEQTQKQNELIEKQNDLEKARTQRVKVYRKGLGFVYEQDTQAVKEATTALQDYKKEVEKSPELQAWENIRSIFDQAEIDAEIKNLEVLAGGSFSSLFGKFGTDISKWSNWVKTNLATNYGYENLLEHMDSLEGWKAISAFLGADGIVNQSQIEKYINKNKFASGSLATPAGFARVGEQGYEIALFGKGDAVIPHNVSENLMAWGAHSPIEYASAMANTTSNSYHFDSLVLPNVTDANSLLNELNNLPNRALQYSKSRA